MREGLGMKSKVLSLFFLIALCSSYLNAYFLELQAPTNNVSATWESTIASMLTHTNPTMYINYVVHPKRTLLHGAAGRGAVALVVKILSAPNKADFINKTDACGYTALHYAVLTGNKDTVQKLIAAGARPDLVETKTESIVYLGSVYTPPQNRYNALHMTFIALQPGLPGRSDFFNAGVRLVGGPVSQEQVTAVLQELLKSSSKDAALRAQDSNGNTPLHLAVIAGHQEAIKLLLASGAPQDIRNSQSKTPEELAQGSVKNAFEIYRSQNAAANALKKSIVVTVPKIGWK